MTPQPSKLSGRVALITGGTSGIGRATSLLFAAEGADVVITGRRTELGEKVVAEMRHRGGRPLFIKTDHARLEDCARAVVQCIEVLGRIDILFNNVGLVLQGTAETTSEDDWGKLMNLNLTCAWRMSRLTIPHMRSNGNGVIVNNASDWGMVGAANALAYCVSKGALIQLTRCMALDYAQDKIRVNAVCPGDTFVERWVEQGYFANSTPVTREEAARSCAMSLPIRRFAEVDEIARSVLFLASDDSSFMTGQTLVVDGGNTAR